MTDMTMDEILKRYPVGTVLKLTATVISHDATDEGTPVAVTFDNGVHTYEWINPRQLAAAEIVNRPIQAGDKVRWTGGDLISEVIHTDGNNAWVRVTNDASVENVIAHISDLEPAE